MAAADDAPAGSQPPADEQAFRATPGWRVAYGCVLLLAFAMPLIEAGSPVLAVKHVAYLGLALVGVAALLLDALKGAASPAFGTPVDAAVALYLATAFPAVMLANNPGMARYELGLTAAMGLSFVLALKTVRTPRHVRLVFAAVLLASVVIAFRGLSGYARFVTEGASESSRSGYLSTELFAHSYLAAQYLVMGFVGGVVLLLHGGLRGWRTGAVALALVPIGVYLFVIGSRGAYLAVVLALGASTLLLAGSTSKREGDWARLFGRILLVLVIAATILVLGSITGLLGGAPSYALERLLLFFDPAASDFNFSRLDVWKHVLEMSADHMLFGVGLGSFDTTFPSYHFSERIIAHAHNQYLQVLAERGLIGLVAFLFVLRYGLHAARKGVRALAGDRERLPLFLATAAALTAAAIYFLFETPLVWSEASCLIVMLLAVLSRAGCTTRTRPTGLPAATAAMILLAGTLGLVVPVWAQYLRASGPAGRHFAAVETAFEALASGDRKGARQLLADALIPLDEADAIFPYKADFARMKASVLSDLGRLEEALVANGVADHRQPNTYQFLNAIGKLHMRLRQYDAAVEPLRRAILAHRDIGSEDTYASLGRAYLYLERYEEAWIVFGDLIHQYYYHEVQPRVLLDAADTLIGLDRNLQFVELLLEWYLERVPEEELDARRVEVIEQNLRGMRLRPKRPLER